MRPLLRPVLLAIAGHAAAMSMACTAFKTTVGGHTFIGNNEDAWSINPQVRFEQGRNGGYGSIYFGHYNGHPLRVMVDQIGMNEMGLVMDGLSIQPKEVPAIQGRKSVPFDALMPMVLRSCADVRQAAAILRTTDNSWLRQSMLFLADRHGEYMIVEADTLILGNDPTYAVGNWRMSSCSDPDSIPIPRLQAGRALLAEGMDTSMFRAFEVLRAMKACRQRFGEGTLFSTLFDPAEGKAHLYFYHDFSEAVTFNLKDELAKGDHTVAMASLFGTRPEFDRLKGYLTPFHQRWLFWAMLALAGAAALAGCIALFLLGRALVARFSGKAAYFTTPLLLVPVSVAAIALLGVLLMKEGIYYFGPGDMAPFFAWLPLILCTCSAPLLWKAWTQRRIRTWPLVLGAITILPFLALLGYWGILWP